MNESHPLKTYREQQDPPLSQEELGAQLGVKKSTISRWENGKRMPRSRKMLKKIHERTGLPASTFLQEEMA
jgi:transcriptional regulator with XRE-family HTH domain